MTLLKPNRTSTKAFTYTPSTRHFTACISDTNGMGRVWDDACDTGLTLVSSRTGREIVFVVTDMETREGDTMLWHLRPVDSSCPYRLTLFND